MIIDTARALMAVLQPLTGDRAAGNLVVSAAPGPTAELPSNAYAVPVIAGSARYDLLFKTGVNPNTPAGGWTIGAATLVPMFSNVGGAAHNIPAATPMRWFPALEGIEPVSIVDPAGLAGATAAPPGLSGVKQIAFFEELGVINGAEALRTALVARFPALIVAWESTGPSTPLGRNNSAQKELWSVYVVVSRQDADPARRLEGLALVDAVTALLDGRASVDGFHFSSPSRIDITARQIVTVNESFAIYRVRFTTSSTSSTQANSGLAVNPWLRTRLDIDVPVPESEGGYPLVNDNELDMPHS